MPYTKNTRIKVVNKKFHKEYTAQVEYRYPFTNIKVWEDFQNTSCNVLKGVLTNGSGCSIPLNAYYDCLWDDYVEEVKGLEWAKAIIDRYHKLLAEKEHKNTVEYIKYPDEDDE